MTMVAMVMGCVNVFGFVIYMRRSCSAFLCSPQVDSHLFFYRGWGACLLSLVLTVKGHVPLDTLVVLVMVEGRL